MNKQETIEAAYLAGFEPSTDNLSEQELFSEAMQYLLCLHLVNA